MMIMFLAGVAAVLGLSVVGVLILLWRAPLLPQTEDGFEPVQAQSPSIDPA